MESSQFLSDARSPPGDGGGGLTASTVGGTHGTVEVATLSMQTSPAPSVPSMASAAPSPSPSPAFLNDAAKNNSSTHEVSLPYSAAASSLSSLADVVRFWHSFDLDGKRCPRQAGNRDSSVSGSFRKVSKSVSRENEELS